MKSSRLGILSSMVAPLCCLGPMIAISVGMGGVGVAAFFGKTHWLWSVLGVALLGAGWTLYWKESRKGCETGCDLSARKRTRNILLSASVVVGVFLAMHLWSQFIRRPEPSIGRPAAGETATIPVEGMVCFTCEVSLENRLKKSAGIVSVDADSSRKTVTVQFDPHLTNKTTIIEQINSMGYKVQSG